MMISEDIFHYLDSLAIQRIYPVWFLPKLRRRRLCLKSGARPSMDDAFFASWPASHGCPAQQVSGGPGPALETHGLRKTTVDD